MQRVIKVREYLVIAWTGNQEQAYGWIDQLNSILPSEIMSIDEVAETLLTRPSDIEVIITIVCCGEVKTIVSSDKFLNEKLVRTQNERFCAFMLDGDAKALPSFITDDIIKSTEDLTTYLLMFAAEAYFRSSNNSPVKTIVNTLSVLTVVTPDGIYVLDQVLAVNYDTKQEGAVKSAVRKGQACFMEVLEPGKALYMLLDDKSPPVFHVVTNPLKRNDVILLPWRDLKLRRIVVRLNDVDSDEISWMHHIVEGGDDDAVQMRVSGLVPELSIDLNSMQEKCRARV